MARSPTAQRDLTWPCRRGRAASRSTPRIGPGAGDSSMRDRLAHAMETAEETGVVTRDSDTRRATWPPVSVVMPALNEERFLRDAVNKVLAQDYPGELEIVIAVAPSSDRTHEIADEIAAADPRV